MILNHLRDFNCTEPGVSKMSHRFFTTAAPTGLALSPHFERRVPGGMGVHMKKLLVGPTAWLRLADKLDYFIRRWLIPLRIEG